MRSCGRPVSERGVLIRTLCNIILMYIFLILVDVTATGREVAMEICNYLPEIWSRDGDSQLFAGDLQVYAPRP